jgi:hypothetical protein
VQVHPPHLVTVGIGADVGYRTCVVAGVGVVTPDAFEVDRSDEKFELVHPLTTIIPMIKNVNIIIF